MTFETSEQKAEWHKAYARGYQAGRKRKAVDVKHESRNQTREDVAFWERVFLSVGPSFVESAPWKQGDKVLSSLDDRVQLAADWATAAVKQRRKVLP